MGVCGEGEPLRYRGMFKPIDAAIVTHQQQDSLRSGKKPCPERVTAHLHGQGSVLALCLCDVSQGTKYSHIIYWVGHKGFYFSPTGKMAPVVLS